MPDYSEHLIATRIALRKLNDCAAKHNWIEASIQAALAVESAKLMAVELVSLADGTGH